MVNLTKKELNNKVFFEICDKLDYYRMSPLQIKQELAKFIEKNINKVARGSLESIIAKLSDMYLDFFWSNKEYAIFDDLDDELDFI